MLNIILIDDEEVVLQGMKHLLQGESSEYKILKSFCDPTIAIEFIRQNAELIDVVVTDIKMPSMSGVALVKYIQEIRSEIAVIAMSAYTDYEYIRQAMKNGATDYLLKPCKRQEILDLFQKVEQQKKKQLESDKIKRCERFLRKIVQEGIIKTGIDVGLWEIDTKIRCILYPGTNELLEKQEKLLESFQKEGVIGFLEGYDVWTFEKIREQATSQQRLEHIFLWNKTELEKNIYDLKKKKEYLIYNEKDILEENFFGKTTITQEASLSDYFPFVRIEQSILRARPDQLQLAFKEGVHKIRSKAEGWDPDYIKKEINRFCYLVEERLKTEEKGQHLEHNREQENILMEIRKSTTLTETLNAMLTYLMFLLSLFQEKTRVPVYIRKAAAFMEANYMQEISLQIVAEYVALNPWYFSSQFKKYMGISMGEYLNHVRISASVRLMQESDLKLGEIAELVGFRDSGYFSNVFKKMKNISPKEYRMTILKNKIDM